MPDGSQLALRGGTFPFEVDELVERCNYAFTSQQNFRNTMERKRQLLLPDAAPFFIANQTQGQRDRQNCVDTFGQYAVRTHATFQFSSLVNGDGDWFKVVSHGHKGADDTNTKSWAKDFRDHLAGDLMDPSTGFVDQLFAMLLERAAFDNARLYIGDRPGGLPIVRMSPMRDSAWEAGTGHEPDTHWWKQSLSAAEWARKFPGKDLGNTIKSAAEDSRRRNDQFTIIHGVIENPGWTPNVAEESPAQRRYLSFWIAEADKVLVSHAWPSSNAYSAYRCPRRPNEQIGRGASDEALEEVQMAQRVRVAIIRGYEKGIDPLMLLPDDGIMTPPTNEPQGAIVVRADMLTGRGGDPVRYLQHPGQPDKGQEWLTTEIYGAIKRAYSLDLMSLPREPRMLDSQIVGLQEEQSRGVVPLMSPLYAPLGRSIARFADIRQRQGKLPLPPRAAAGLKISLEFKNPLERAARLAEVRAFMQALSILSNASNIDPSARHSLKVVEGCQYCFRILGVPEHLIPSKQEIDAAIQADSQAMANKAGRETGLDATTMLKNIGGAARGLVTPEMLQGGGAGGGAANAA
jgi:hypothetical protein